MSDLPTLLCFDLYSSIAQSVEHLTVNQGVTGSSPVGGARKKHLQSQVLFSTKSADGGINPPSVDEIASR